MWKLAGISCGIPFLLILIMFAGSGAAMGACGIDPPPEPPGGFSWPATGELTRGWTLDCKSDRGHRGIDIAAPSGSPVRAAAAGTVSFAAYTPAEGGGMTISIDHPGGLRSTYLHVTAPAISRGDIVSAGQVIAITTETPLHFGIKIPGSRDTYYDPLGLLPPMSSRTGLAPPEADRWPAADYSSAVAGPAAAPATAPSAASVPEPSLLPEASLGLSIMPEPARPEKAAYPEPSTASKPAAAAKPSAAYKPAAAAKPSAVPGTLVAPQAADVDRIPAVLDEPIFIQKSHAPLQASFHPGSAFAGSASSAGSSFARMVTGAGFPVDSPASIPVRAGVSIFDEPAPVLYTWSPVLPGGMVVKLATGHPVPDSGRGAKLKGGVRPYAAAGAALLLSAAAAIGGRLAGREAPKPALASPPGVLV